MFQITRSTIRSPRAVELIKAKLFQFKVQAGPEEKINITVYGEDLGKILNALSQSELLLLATRTYYGGGQFIKKLTAETCINNIKALKTYADEVLEVHPFLQSHYLFHSVQHLARYFETHPESWKDIVANSEETLDEAVKCLLRANVGTPQEIYTMAQKTPVLKSILVGHLYSSLTFNFHGLPLNWGGGRISKGKESDTILNLLRDGVASLPGRRKSWFKGKEI